MRRLFLVIFLIHSSIWAVSLDKMISSMIVVGFTGTKEVGKWVEQIKRDIKRDRILGVYISKRNIKDLNSLQKLTTYLKSAAKHKIFIITTPFNFKEFDRDFNKITLKDIKSKREHFYNMIQKAGINSLFWPNLDLKTGKTYSSYEDILLSYVDLELSLIKKSGLISVFGHFPGKKVESKKWEYRELKPFYTLIKEQKCNAVIVDDKINPTIDDKNRAVFSYLTIERLLREKMGFKGVVFSSDLKSKEIEKKYSLKERVVKSINSGVNILFFSGYFVNSSNVPKEVKKIVKQAVKDGEIDRQKIEESYKKILEIRGLIK